MGKIYLNSEEYGGSDVSITPTLAVGTKIADYEINGASGALYAPSSGGSSDIVLLEGATQEISAETVGSWVFLMSDHPEITNLDDYIVAGCMIGYTTRIGTTDTKWWHETSVGHDNQGNIQVYPRATIADDGTGYSYVQVEHYNSSASAGFYKCRVVLMKIKTTVITDRLTPVLANVQRNYGTGASTYTATENCYVLCLNMNNNGEASDKTLTSTFTTAGTLVFENEYTSSWSSPDRNNTTKIALYELLAGQSITFENTIAQSGFYTTQVHIAWIVDSDFASTITGITREQFVSKSDNTLGTLQTVTTLDTGAYLVLGFETAGSGVSGIDATVSTPTGAYSEHWKLTDDNTYAITEATYMEATQITSLDITYASKTSYISRGYAVYKFSLQ